MQRRLVVAGAIALSALGMAIMAGCGGKKQGDSEVVARVNGTSITRGEVVKLLEQQDRGSMLQELITRELFRQKAKEKGVKVTDEEINRRLASAGDDVLAGTGQTLEQYVKDNGQTLQDWKEQAASQILMAKMLLQPQARQEYFEAHKKEFEGLPQNNESVIYRHLVVGTKDEATSLRQQILSAKDKDAQFATLAKEKSLDVMSRARYGMAGWLIKGKSPPRTRAWRTCCSPSSRAT